LDKKISEQKSDYKKKSFKNAKAENDKIYEMIKGKNAKLIKKQKLEYQYFLE